MLLAELGYEQLDACEMPSLCSPTVVTTGQHQAGWKVPPQLRPFPICSLLKKRWLESSGTN